jgi:hypothetical protein|tara:strand:+ start:44 stop:310 length:267 start_codon:yes stop_codon:yes gene_type:complete
MIYQLPNGRIIELTLEQYLDLTDDELKDLNGLDSSYTTDPKGPFYKSILDKAKKEKKDISSSGNYEPGIDEISKDDIINDEYFHRDDT